MRFQVINHELTVDYLRMVGVSSSSLVLVGDAGHIMLASMFDTPPESIVVGTSLVPLGI
ncbi:spore gernimation protein GerPD [Fictibacillus sp. KIGAM418]|uniref:Spore gernimation protein GerPD n=1 Tax=Fictibacillus marinisediminis TaxID=2878389 RepID=A0A9X2BCG4_9BACL|nr:spore gernimation protein GerPD [Fictibacillus marinisediminis]MCK6255700.1 spore gernimation protein GerPD [Fictibacillus marinisediminis]